MSYTLLYKTPIGVGSADSLVRQHSKWGPLNEKNSNSQVIKKNFSLITVSKNVIVTTYFTLF